MGGARGGSFEERGTSDLGKELLGIGERGAHEVEPVVFEIELSVVFMEREVSAVGHGGLGELDVGFHRMRVLRQNRNEVEIARGNSRNLTELAAGI